MSQVVKITKFSLLGAAPFIGERATQGGEARVPVWSADPEQVAVWLADAWRTRFNQVRSRRKKYDQDRNLVPIGDRVDERTHAEAREADTWLADVPSLVLEATDRPERTEWFAAAKRRQTNIKKGRKPGKMTSPVCRRAT